MSKPSVQPKVNNQDLYKLAYDSLLELSTPEGINASSKDDLFGCIFGRDSAITINKILRANSKTPTPKLLEIVRGALITLVSLQGKTVNLESGEEPGKFIHEFRKDNFEHLVALSTPWYVYPEGYLKNYDSVDSTALNLIAIFNYWKETKDDQFLVSVLPNIESGLNWIISYGDKDKDFLIEYELPKERSHGGLVVQSWTDSHESIRNLEGHFPKYPIAPVEVQAYYWLALKLWANYYYQSSPQFAAKLESFADGLKAEFNQMFVITDADGVYLAQALDGDKHQITTITGNPLLCLWATYIDEKGQVESILNEELIPQVVKRAFKEDMFDPTAGIRTMSTKALTFNSTQNSYHNGSFWTVLNGMIVEGLENFNFNNEALMLKQASLLPIHHFKTPLELYVKVNGEYLEYKNPSGQVSCKTQAWTAASLLDLTS